MLSSNTLCPAQIVISNIDYWISAWINVFMTLLTHSLRVISTMTTESSRADVSTKVEP